ncbi:hypothetical protein [Streptosporangium sp. 'caverna']|uniref:hypothetical protein n=1 Tax=Streptosporangium sp. 'caverna' TaxID=2202249 RepID=UPI0013A6D35C|nr:hypothetical protein [Streptosporangium sp. 'caverna']
MDAGDWIAVAALVVALAAGYFAAISARAARRSANEAARLSGIEAERRRDEREERHERLAPSHPGSIVAVLEESAVGGPKNLFGSITVPRDYRVQAEGWVRDSYTLLSLPLLLHANRPYRFHIEHWPPDREEPQTQEVRFHFWPPVDVDDTDPWTCSCGRPTGENADSFGHWELRVPITYEPPMTPWIDYA